MKTDRRTETNQYAIQPGIALVSLTARWKHYDRKNKPGPTLFVNSAYIGITRKDAAVILRGNRNAK